MFADTLVFTLDSDGLRTGEAGPRFLDDPDDRIDPRLAQAEDLRALAESLAAPEATAEVGETALDTDPLLA